MKKFKNIMLVILTLTIMVACSNSASAADHKINFKFVNSLTVKDTQGICCFHNHIKAGEMVLVNENNEGSNYLEIYDDGVLIDKSKYTCGPTQCYKATQTTTLIDADTQLSSGDWLQVAITFTNPDEAAKYFDNNQYESYVYMNGELAKGFGGIYKTPNKTTSTYTIRIGYGLTGSNTTLVDFTMPSYGLGSDIPKKEDFAGSKWTVDSVVVKDIDDLQPTDDTTLGSKKYLVQVTICADYYGSVENVTVNGTTISKQTTPTPQYDTASWELNESNRTKLTINYILNPGDSHSIKVMDNQEHGKVFIDRPNATSGTVYLASIPDAGYYLDKYVYIDDNGQMKDLTGNSFAAPTLADKDFYVGAIFKKATRRLDDFEIKIVNKIADMVDLDRKTFADFIKALPSQDDYQNSAIYLLDLIRPFYKEFYGMPYEKNTPASTTDSISEFVFTGLFNHETQGDIHRITLTGEEYETFAKETMGLLMLSHFELINPSQSSDGASVLYLGQDPMGLGANVAVFTSDILAGKTGVDLFRDAIDVVSNYINDIVDKVLYALDCTIDEYNENDFYTPIYALISLLDWHDWAIDDNGKYYENSYDRYESYIDSYLLGIRPSNLDPESELEKKYEEIDKVAKEEFDKWAESSFNFDDLLDDIITNGTYDYLADELQKVTDLETQLANPQLSDDDKSNLKLELAKEEVRITTRAFCDTVSLLEAEFMNLEPTKTGYFFGDSNLREHLAQIISSIITIRNTASVKSYENVHDSGLFDKIFDDPKLIDTYLGAIQNLKPTNEPNITNTKNYYNSLRTEIKEKPHSNPNTSSSGKTYSAKDDNKTTEKISGSGKKGSTRTITPKPNRKVVSVKVTDKDGNKVDVTQNEDGTYSFVQPASNVTVEVLYEEQTPEEKIQEELLKDDVKKANSSEGEKINPSAKYIKGYDDGTFRANNTVNNIELMSMVTELFDNVDITSSKDLGQGKDYWGQEIIDKANVLGLIPGDKDSKNYNLMGDVTRGDLAIVVYNLVKDFSESPSLSTRDNCKDVIGKNYEKHAAKLLELGIFKGYDDGLFHGDYTLTRAEAVVVINRALKSLGFEINMPDIKLSFPDLSPKHWAYAEIMYAANK